MTHDLMIYQSEHNDLRLQRRIRISAHIAAYMLFCVVQGLLLPYDMFALGFRSFLFMTIIMHISWLYSAARPLLSDRLHRPVPQLIPLLPEGQSHAQQPDFQQNDFWYRWHDL